MSQPFNDARREISERIAQAEHLLVCLDYDGTLTHFTANPAAASLSPQIVRVLSLLTQHETATLAIISGRDRADLQSRVDIPGLIYGGNHGLEISGPGFVFVEPTAAAQAEALQVLAVALEKKLQAISGVIVEFKGLTASVHYRQVDPADWEEVRRVVHGVLAGENHPFVLTTGAKVFEIRPRVYWNKGSAVNLIRERLDQPGTLALYVGDDTTDEDVFASLADGITIKVGDSQETAAAYLLEGPPEVRMLLEWIDHLLRHKEGSHPEPVVASGDW